MESIKELRSRNKADTIKRRVIPGRPILDQVISANKRDGGMKVRAPGPGLKQQAIDETVPHCDVEEATSIKPQASSAKLRKHQATSLKPQAASVKLQATSVKLHDS